MSAKAQELRKKFLDYFRARGHAILPSASLIPADDSSVLFTTAGMHPLIPYLTGAPHPQGKRLASLQKCVRTTDIDEVGDRTHLTFFEMLGNWSLGDYGKREAVEWSYEFITHKRWLGFSADCLHVTIFAGDGKIPRDRETEEIWRGLGIPPERIWALGREDNWWGPVGETGPCGPDTEMFIDTGMPPCGPECRPGCGCGKYVEIWNDVFMIYERQPDGSYRELKQKNIDTGMGVERTVMVLEGKQSVFATSVFAPLRAALKEENLPVKSRRIILDHLRASVHIMGDERGVSPSNREQGYIVRRLLRRSIRLLRQTELDAAEIAKRLCAVARAVVREDGEQGPYKELLERRSFIEENIAGEVARFTHTLAQGERRLAKMLSRLQGKVLSGAEAFELYESCGFPLELTEEIAAEQGYKVDRRGFYAAQEEHRRKSRGTGARFAGGLADHSPAVVRLHTATHLLHAALRRVLGKHVRQKGSNITRERLRFDFTHPQALTAKEIKRVEEMVNEQIRRDIPVERKEMSLAKAKTLGALGFFEEKYGERVSVYRIGDFSLEICGGPHVRRTGELGTFRIVEEEALGAGVRRLRAILEKS